MANGNCSVIQMQEGKMLDSSTEANNGQMANSKSDTKEAANTTIISSLGDFCVFGRYTIFVIVLYELILLPMIANMTFMVFGGFSPRLQSCGGGNHSFEQFSQTAEACAELRRLRELGICEQPELEVQFESVAYEFGYICEQTVEVKKSISAQMFGVLCGAILFGQLSDWFGRKRCMLVTLFGMALFLLAASTADSLFQFTAVQFVTMVFVGGQGTIVHVFLLENVPKRHRLWIMNVVSYSPNMVLIVGMAYLAGEWRSLLRVIAIPTVPAFGLLLFAFESPRWLVHKGRWEDAHRVLERIERFNGTATPERLQLIDELVAKAKAASSTKRHGKRYNYLHLFYTWPLFACICVISFSLLSLSVIAYAVIFNMDNVSGSIYLNMVVFASIRYVLNILVSLLDFFAPKAGRRPIYAAVVSLMLISIGIVFASKVFELREPGLLRAMLISTAALTSPLYVINHVVTNEVFPTPIRNAAASFVQIFNRIGTILSPHLFYLAFFWTPLPFLVMLCLLVANLLLYALFVPETKGHAMVDHMPGKDQRIILRSRGPKADARRRKPAGNDDSPALLHN